MFDPCDDGKFPFRIAALTISDKHTTHRLYKIIHSMFIIFGLVVRLNSSCISERVLYTEDTAEAMSDKAVVCIYIYILCPPDNNKFVTLNLSTASTLLVNIHALSTCGRSDTVLTTFKNMFISSGIR